MSDLSEVRSDLSKIQNSMGRIEERLDGLIDSHKERAKRHDEMDARLRELENRTSNAAGKDAVRTGVISIAAAGVMTWIGRHLPIIIVLGLLMFTVSKSAAEEPHVHGQNVPDWYDPDCCNYNDCRPTADENIEFIVQNGQVVARHKPSGSIFTRDRFRVSKDERYHVCISPTGIPYCFYDRVGA